MPDLLHLVQFAKMGSIYMEHVVGVKNPKVGIVNIGAEEEKGNALVKETFPLLKQCGDINFTGSIEAREIPAGACDVVVCEAFVGNVILKLYEGVGSVMIKKIKEGLKSDVKTAVGGMLIKPALKKTLKSFDASRVRRSTASRTEGAGCQDTRKCKGRRGGALRIPVRSVQTAEDQ